MESRFGWKRLGPLIITIGIFFLAVQAVPAQDSMPVEEALEGFEDETSEEEALKGFDEIEAHKPVREPSHTSEPSPLQVDGFLKIGASYNFAHDAPQAGETDWHGVSRLRPELQIDAGLRFNDNWKGAVSGRGFYDLTYAIRGRDRYTSQVLDAHETEWELGETYIQGSIFNHLDVKIGRQIVTWGKFDYIRITDVLNPLDLREPGITDIENLRLPVTMTRLDHYFENWSITGIAVHEIRFNKMPAFGHDFFPAATPLPFEQIPADGGGNTEYAIAVNGFFNAWDIAFYGAELSDDDAHAVAVVKDARIQTELRHARLKLLGGAFNIAAGDWLFKMEVAFFDGLEFFNTPGRTFSRLDLGAGIEYTGFRDTTLSIESVNRRILEYERVLRSFPDQTKENETQTVIGLSRDYLNQTLTLTYLLSLFGATGQDGLMQRFSVDYALTDAIRVIGGVIYYESGDFGLYRNIGDNDRLYLEIKYSF